LATYAAPAPCWQRRREAGMSDVYAVNRRHAIAITDEGDRLPIVNWLDSDGDECEPQNAVACVAEYGDKFLAINLMEFENVFSN
jgi:hypothetical protein